MSDPLALKVARLRPDAKLPTKAHDDDAAFDLYCVEPIEVHRGAILVPTGLAIAVPSGWCGRIVGRSGLAARGVVVLGGLLDHGYTGEVRVILGLVHGGYPMWFQAGERVAQLMLVPVPPAVVVEVGAGELSASDRGGGGFGSSGK
jgi:dUTP pyrophosphatase